MQKNTRYSFRRCVLRTSYSPPPRPSTKGLPTGQFHWTVRTSLPISFETSFPNSRSHSRTCIAAVLHLQILSPRPSIPAELQSKSPQRILLLRGTADFGPQLDHDRGSAFPRTVPPLAKARGPRPLSPGTRCPRVHTRLLACADVQPVRKSPSLRDIFNACTRLNFGLSRLLRASSGFRSSGHGLARARESTSGRQFVGREDLLHSCRQNTRSE